MSNPAGPSLHQLVRTQQNRSQHCRAERERCNSRHLAPVQESSSSDPAAGYAVCPTRKSFSLLSD